MQVMDAILKLFRAKPTEAEHAERTHITAQIKVATYQQTEATRRLERAAEASMNRHQSIL